MYQLSFISINILIQQLLLFTAVHHFISLTLIPIGVAGDENTPPVAAVVRLSFEEEVLLNLHRHWSLREAVKNSLVTSAAFKLFTLKGQKRLQEFLAHAG